MDFEERSAVRNRKVTVSVSLPVSLIDVLDRIVDSESAPICRIYERVIRKGLQVERNERAEKAGK